MKKLILTLLILTFNLSLSQEKVYKVKKITSTQFGNIPSGKTYFNISDSLIVLKTKEKSVDFKVTVLEDNENSKTYLCNYNSQSEVRFTYFKKDNYLRFENKDLFSGKIGELFYYFE